MDQDRRAFLRIRQIHIRLTGDEPVSIDRARGYEADAFAVSIDHRVAVVRHTDALFIECEADDGALAFFLARYVSISTNEPRLVRFDVRTESAFSHSEIAS